MAGKIPDETLQAIRERISIVEVVSGYVSLKKAGRNHLGLCPFHAEKTPSFTVNDERGLFHCFGCGAGGTVFSFVMRADRVDFPEAVEVLARRAGVALPKRHDPAAGGQHDQLIRLNELAQRCFREALQSPAGLVARQYLDKRGLSPATIERYGLGFCPANGSGLAVLLASKPLATQKAVELGLLGRRTNGRVYDRFWGRIMFPIRDGSGQLRGFGGRTLGSERPKYLNSPESALFHKEQVLYGLFEARQAVREAERIVIVEGYLDALALVESGIGYVVASLGTAATAEPEKLGERLGRRLQLNLARRLARQVVVFFDGDRAGEDAAVRAFGQCIEAGIWGLAAVLPKGYDPDTFVRERGAAATLALIQQAEPLWETFLKRHDPGPSATVPQRVRAAREIKAVIARGRDEVQYGILAKQAAERLGIDESSFREIRPPSMPMKPGHVGTVEPVEPYEEFRPEEEMLIEAMALDREVARLVAHRGVLGHFHSTRLAEIGHKLLGAWERENDTTSTIDCLPQRLAERVTAECLGKGSTGVADRLQVARDCIERIELRVRDMHARERRAKLREAESSGDEGRLREELQRFNEDLHRRKEIGHG